MRICCSPGIYQFFDNKLSTKYRLYRMTFYKIFKLIMRNGFAHINSTVINIKRALLMYGQFI